MEARKSIDLKSFRMEMSENDIDIFIVMTFERLSMCRDLGCFVGCWQHVGAPKEQDHIKFTNIFGKSFSIFFCKTEASPQLNILTAYNDNWWNAPLTTNPASDKILFDEVYMFIHHQNFGICQAKNNIAQTPLTRIDSLEEKLKALETAVRGGLTDEDEKDLLSIGVKRPKPDES